MTPWVRMPIGMQGLPAQRCDGQHVLVQDSSKPVCAGDVHIVAASYTCHRITGWELETEGCMAWATVPCMWLGAGWANSRQHNGVRVQHGALPSAMAVVAMSLWAQAKPYGSDLFSLLTTRNVASSLKKLLR